MRRKKKPDTKRGIPIKFLRLVVILGLIYCVCFFSVRGAAWYVVNNYVQPEKDRQQALVESLKGPFFKDLQRLSEIGFFRARTLQKDAGPYLNPRVPWVISTANAIEAVARFRQDYPDVSPIPRIPAVLAKRLAETNRDLLQLVLEMDKAAPDFSWLAKLQSFDYWDFGNKSPLQRMEIPEPFFAVPVPDFRTLSGWARLALVQAIQYGQTLKGLQQIRKVAELEYRSGSLVGALNAAMLLHHENLAYQSELLIDPQLRRQWTPIPPAETARALRTFSFYPRIFFPLVPKEYSADLLGSFGKTVFEKSAGICSAISEAVITDLLLTSSDDFFRELRSRDRDLLSSWADYCPLTWARHLFTHPKLRAHLRDLAPIWDDEATEASNSYVTKLKSLFSEFKLVFRLFPEARKVALDITFAVTDFRNSKGYEEYLSRENEQERDILGRLKIAVLANDALKLHETLYGLPPDNAPLNSWDEELKSPLFYAVETGNAPMVEKLITNGAKVDLKSPFGATALMWALARGQKRVVLSLLAAKADTNESTLTGITPLMIAAAHGNREFVSLLLKYGADPAITDLRSQTAETVATRRGFRAVAALLRDELRARETVKEPGHQ